MKTYLCDNCGELVPTRMRNCDHKTAKLRPEDNNIAEIMIGHRDVIPMRFKYEVDRDICYKCVVPVFTEYFKGIADDLKEQYDKACIEMKIRTLANIPVD